MSQDSNTPCANASSLKEAASRLPINLPRLQAMRDRGEKIAVLTAYDATFAAVADQAGIDCLLVGDSVGMVTQGKEHTIGVTMEHMIYHTQNVAQGLRRAKGAAWIIADMPFGSYEASTTQAMTHATQLMQAGAHMVKIEGGGWTLPLVHFLVERGIPVCAHLGLTPQTIHALGGYRVQGRADKAEQLLQQAKELSEAGASMMVLEMIPYPLAQRITDLMPHCHTIGIGAGNATAGQVLVMHDLLGIHLHKPPRFAHDFLKGQSGIAQAIQAYVSAVKSGQFPDHQLHAWEQ